MLYRSRTLKNATVGGVLTRCKEHHPRYNTRCFKKMDHQNEPDDEGNIDPECKDYQGHSWRAAVIKPTE